MEKKKSVLGIVEWIVALALVISLSVMAFYTKDRLQELLGIKNVTRDQIFSYKYINDGEE
jgi:hypothetical protein